MKSLTGGPARYLWECKTCGWTSGTSTEVREHQQTTSHPAVRLHRVNQ